MRMKDRVREIRLNRIREQNERRKLWREYQRQWRMNDKNKRLNAAIYKIMGQTGLNRDQVLVKTAQMLAIAMSKHGFDIKPIQTFKYYEEGITVENNGHQLYLWYNFECHGGMSTNVIGLKI